MGLIVNIDVIHEDGTGTDRIGQLFIENMADDGHFHKPGQKDPYRVVLDGNVIPTWVEHLPEDGALGLVRKALSHIKAENDPGKDIE